MCISICNIKFQMDREQLRLFNDNLNRHNRYFYETHNLPTEESSYYQNLIVNKWNVQLKKANSKFYDFDSFTPAQKGLFLSNKRLKHHYEAQSCSNELVLNESIYKGLSGNYFYTFSCIPQNKCSIKEYKSIGSIVSIITNKTDGFAFSFCPNCLYDFGYVLKEVYCHPDFDYIQKGYFSIKSTEKTERCFFCGEDNSKTYQLKIYDKTLYTDYQCLRKLAFAMISSAAYKELFFDEYIEFRNAYIHQKSILERNEKKVEKAKTIAKIEKERVKITHKLEQEMSEKLSIKKLKSNQALLNLFSTRVLYCQRDKSHEQNLGYPKTKIEKYPFEKFTTIYIEGIDSRTFHHNTKQQSDVIMYVDRPNDRWCFSFTYKDLKTFRNALQNVNEANPYHIDDIRGFEIRRISRFGQNEFCYFCGNENYEQYNVRFGRISFSFCKDCKEKIIEQITEILNTK